jgi:hypothetical protein
MASRRLAAYVPRVPLRPQSPDTSLLAERIQIEAWQRMTPARKLELVGELMRAADELARAGVRARHPHADAREMRLRLAALRLDRSTLIRHFDWDPEIEGY